MDRDGNLPEFSNAKSKNMDLLQLEDTICKQGKGEPLGLSCRGTFSLTLEAE